MFGCAVVLLCLTYSTASNVLDGEKVQTRQFDHLKRLAENVGWKPIVKPNEAELKAIESKARIDALSEIEKNTLKVAAGECPPGYTGTNCTSPICYNSSTFTFHNGNADYGDDIDWEISTVCSDTFNFPLDSYANDVYLTIQGTQSSSPSGRLLSPNGEEVSPTIILMNEPNEWQAKYANLVNERGAGSYSFALHASIASPCVYSVQATTILSTDGGFISDPRDDNVETQKPDGHSGIERMPISGIPSYLAFAFRTRFRQTRPVIVTFFESGIFSDLFRVEDRYGCSAPYFVGPYTCTDINSFYHLKIRGIDTNGYEWQRVYYFDCLPAGRLSEKQ